MTEDEITKMRLADAQKQMEDLIQFKNSVMARAASPTEELLGEILVELKRTQMYLETIADYAFDISQHTKSTEKNTDRIVSNADMIEINTSGL